LRSLADWLSYQQRTHPRAVDLTLERVASVAHRLDLLAPRADVVTVAGTNGKGSTATTLACLLHACGQRVGLFTSPHLVRYNERIQIDGAPVSDEDLLHAFERIEQARTDTTLTFFEYSTLAALILFQRSQVEMLVLEVGLGGRLDATNIIDADVAVLCSVGFDHRDYLGNTLEQIGAEKAGIFRRHQNVVLGTTDMPGSVWEAVRKLGCRVYAAEREFSWRMPAAAHALAEANTWDYQGVGCELAELPPPALAGQIQYRNAASALTALQLLSVPARCERERIVRGLRQVRLPGRFQIVPGEVEWILDVAHNEPAAAILAAALIARPVSGRTIAVAGMLSDKDAAAVGAVLDPIMDMWLLSSIDDESRGLAAERLRERMPTLRGAVELVGDVTAGCERARGLARAGDRVVVLGSFHMVGPALVWLGLY
jgi:dihydrofolate synthase/folylpolyglutamate synthase